MTQTKRCFQCKKELSLDKFSKSKALKDGFQVACKECKADYSRRYRQYGEDIRKKIILESGGCQNPECDSSPERGRLLTTGHNYGLFELDHIDESLKLRQDETKSGFIVANEKDFWLRVKPNLQVLCCQCHAIKSANARKTGNSVHQKIFGRRPPPEFINPEYNLFNQVQTTHTDLDEDNWSFEGDYSVCRDSEGFLIKYIDLQKGSTQFQIFNKDGEQI